MAENNIKLVDGNVLAYQTEKIKQYVDSKSSESESGGLWITGSLNANTRVEITESGTWTVPDGVTSVDVFLVGGGGGASSSSAPYAYSGGGGGYTAFYEGIAVTAGEEIDIVIGAGGTSASTATNGGYTQFKSSVYQALGGYASTSSTGGNGGSGGVAKNTTGSGAFKIGVNGGHSIKTVTISSTDYTVIDAIGQGTPTTDPYSGIRYSDGGGYESYNNNPDQYGRGGYAKGRQTGATSYTTDYYDGNQGVCIIYYNTGDTVLRWGCDDNGIYVEQEGEEDE